MLKRKGKTIDEIRKDKIRKRNEKKKMKLYRKDRRGKKCAVLKKYVKMKIAIKKKEN